MAHAAFGGLAALGWLLLPPTTAPTVADRTTDTAMADRTTDTALADDSGHADRANHADRAEPPAARETAAEDTDSSATDLILPVAAAGAAAAVATYSLMRRRRRTALHTTPAGGPPPSPAASLPDLRDQGRRLLVATDDSVRTSAEELRFAAARAGNTEARPYVDALTEARAELSAAFRARRQLDELGEGPMAVPPETERALWEEVVLRCTTAQRRLDVVAPGFDQLRALERDMIPALECAEARFRELTTRTSTVATTLTDLHDRYAPTALLSITGDVEQAKDRLVFATAELNRARQHTDTTDHRIAAAHLRAAEGAIDQADIFVTGVERLATALSQAAETAKHGVPYTGSYADPLDALRRQGRWLLPAHSAVTSAADFITTHRAAVTAEPRTLLAEAERQLRAAETTTPSSAPEGTPYAQQAHTLAQKSRRLAEQDVRAYGNPYGGPLGDGMAGALLGGILLGGPEAGRGDLRGPACYGGPATRERRVVGGQF
ncbi:hypothetical protein ACWD4G_24465 [Streptomyces sp. NPDC002643]